MFTLQTTVEMSCKWKSNKLTSLLQNNMEVGNEKVIELLNSNVFAKYSKHKCL